MKIINCIQGSPEWFQARCGIPTASGFEKILTASGKPSKQREKYLYQLAGEKVTGKPEETYQNGAMKRGTEMEYSTIMRTMTSFCGMTQSDVCGVPSACSQ